MWVLGTLNSATTFAWQTSHPQWPFYTPLSLHYFMIDLFLLCVHAQDAHVWGITRMHVWRPEDSLVESPLSSHL